MLECELIVQVPLGLDPLPDDHRQPPVPEQGQQAEQAEHKHAPADPLVKPLPEARRLCRGSATEPLAAKIVQLLSRKGLKRLVEDAQQLRLPLAHGQIIRIPFVRHHRSDLQSARRKKLGADFALDGGIGFSAFNPGTGFGVGLDRTQFDGRKIATDHRFQCMPGRQHQHPLRQILQRLHRRCPGQSDKDPSCTTVSMAEIEKRPAFVIH
ncbi:hypothetical protein D3C71_1378240 [compost metagenome]